MTEKQKAILRQYTLDFVLHWRHMVASPVAEIRTLGQAGVERNANLLWVFCQGLGEQQEIVIDSASLGGEEIPAGVMAAYLAKALVHAEKGRFLSFTTEFKNNEEHRKLLGVMVGDRLYSLDYLSSLVAEGKSPADVDEEKAVVLPDSGEVRAVRGRNKAVLYSFFTPDRKGEEYVITAQRNPNTTSEDPADRQDPAERLARDEKSQIVTLFCPERRQRTRRAKKETAKQFEALCTILRWMGLEPSKAEANDAVYEEKPGDGCRSINAAAITKVTLGGVTLRWQVAA